MYISSWYIYVRQVLKTQTNSSWTIKAVEKVPDDLQKSLAFPLNCVWFPDLSFPLIIVSSSLICVLIFSQLSHIPLISLLLLSSSAPPPSPLSVFTMCTFINLLHFLYACKALMISIYWYLAIHIGSYQFPPCVWFTSSLRRLKESSACEFIYISYFLLKTWTVLITSIFTNQQPQ